MYWLISWKTFWTWHLVQNRQNFNLGTGGRKTVVNGTSTTLSSSLSCWRRWAIERNTGARLQRPPIPLAPAIDPQRWKRMHASNRIISDHTAGKVKQPDADIDSVSNPPNWQCQTFFLWDLSPECSFWQTVIVEEYARIKHWTMQSSD